MSNVIRDWLLLPVLVYLRRMKRELQMDRAAELAALTGIRDEIKAGLANTAAMQAKLAQMQTALDAANAAASNTTPEVDALIAEMQGLLAPSA